MNYYFSESSTKSYNSWVVVVASVGPDKSEKKFQAVLTNFVCLYILEDFLFHDSEIVECK